MDVNWHGILDAVIAGAVIGILGFAWKMSTGFGILVASVKDIRDNHLPHLQADLTELRQQFVAHLQVGDRSKSGIVG